MDCGADPPEGMQDIETEPTASAQRIARVVMATALVLLGLDILHSLRRIGTAVHRASSHFLIAS